MEDTKSLLMMVLHKVFNNRPKIVEDTFQLIYNYNNGKREKNEYEKTLKTICDLMNGELSSQILVYLLTMVDMPKEQGGSQLPIMEKMQKTQGYLAETVRPQLLECLRSNTVKTGVTKSKGSEEKRPKTESSSSNADGFVKPFKRAKRLAKPIKKTQHQASDEKKIVPNLTDICSSFCIQNEKNLRVKYKNMLEKAWALINNNLKGKMLEECYELIRYLNRMIKLVRMVENMEVTTELLMEEYKDVDIFIREKHLENYIEWDPFVGV